MYFAGSNQTCKVTLALVNGRLKIEPEGETPARFESIQDLDVEPPVPSLPCEITLQDGSKIEVARDSLTAMSLYRKDTGNRLLAWLESNKWACLIATILLPISFYWLTNSVIPTAAMGVAEMIPSSVSRNIDEQVMDIFEGEIIEPSQLDSEHQLKIQDGWNRVLTSLPVDKQQFELLIKKSEFYGANAFALPGGTVVVTDDLANLFKEHPDALNAILLHEIGHVVERHSLRMMTESVGTSLMITYFFGDLEGMAELFSGTALTLMQNKYSRDLEREADQFAIDHLRTIGADPEAFATAMKTLQESMGDENIESLFKYLSTHPEFEERIKHASQ